MISNSLEEKEKEKDKVNRNIQLAIRLIKSMSSKTLHTKLTVVRPIKYKLPIIAQSNYTTELLASTSRASFAI